MYKLLISYPTRSRPEQALNFLQRYVDTIVEKEHLTFNMLCDLDDKTMNTDKISDRANEIAKSIPDFNLYYDENGGKVEAVNRRVGDTDWDIVLVIQDDLWPILLGFDMFIRNEFKKKAPDTDALLHLPDGKLKICTTPCMGRKLYDRLGYVNYPGYKSLMADVDITILAEMLGKKISSNGVILEHVHPAHFGAPWDEQYIYNQQFQAEDQATFDERKANNFGL